MKIHVEIDIYAGPKTVTEVWAYQRSLKKKAIRFKNGREVTNEQLVDFIETSVMEYLTQIKGGK